MNRYLWSLAAVVALAGAGCGGKEKADVPKNLMTPPKEGPKFIGERPRTG